MKTRWCLITAFIIAISLLSACGEEPAKDEFAVDPTQTATSEKPILGVIEGTNCYSGPGTHYDVLLLLDVGQYFDILGIDDDIVWIDDDIVWTDDDVTWFQIDPNAIIDPMPPSRPLNELSPQPDPPGSQMSLRCWVPRNSVELSGDLRQVPVIQMPILGIIEETNCYSGPGTDYAVESFLDVGQYFDILAIDDDIVWIDDDIVWSDESAGWFQIDPNALIDPDPPYRPLNELSPQPDPPGSEMSLRCWVHHPYVEFFGDLSQVPVIVAPPLPTPKPTYRPQPTAKPTSPPIKPTSPPAIDCSSFKSYQECMNYSNYGCWWDDKTGCFKK